MTVLQALHVRMHSFAVIAPLLAAVAAPLAVLLDIPALTQPWGETSNGQSSDHRTKVVLCSVSLVFSCIGNLLLIVRFSWADEPRRHGKRRFSLACWIGKVIITLVNFVVSGLEERQTTSRHAEGFWCAVLSFIISFFVAALLLFNWIVEARSNVVDRGRRDMRIAGRTFMVQVTAFIVLIGVSALIFSRIEHWTYLIGIYFFVTTFTTVGFGDFVATQTSTRILLFPLAVLGIAQLANMVGMIVNFFGEVSAIRRDHARATRERERLAATTSTQGVRDLPGEVEFLEQLNAHQKWVEDMTSLAWSMGGFAVFWLFGALIFSKIERYDYGIGLYFCYTFFLSIGYGDFAPKTSAGRVVFVVYALLAVPVMASFAVQAITQIFGKMSGSRTASQGRRSRKPEGKLEHSALQDAPPDIVDHAAYVATHYAFWESEIERLAHEEQDLDTDMFLIRRVLDKAIEMERHSRRLMINHLEHGSDAQVLLKADRNVQLRDLRSLTEDEVSHEDTPAKRAARFAHSDVEQLMQAMDEEDKMETVRQYRECFAAMLAAGSQLCKLKGKERMIFERRRDIAERESAQDESEMAAEAYASVQRGRITATSGNEGADVHLAALNGQAQQRS